MQSVSLTKPTLAKDPLAKPPLGLCKSQYWLGARSAFGLALPSAQPTAGQMYGPRGVWLDDEWLIVADSGNHRLLMWRLPLTGSHTDAEVVLGQVDFHAEGPAAAGQGPENGVYLPTGVIVVDGRLVVADAWHHRILVWNRIPQKSNTPPDYAIGQTSLCDVAVNRGGEAQLNSLYWPYGCAMVGKRFYVADTGNRRVLYWNRFPDQDRPADGWLGQEDATSNRENRGGSVAANSFRWAHDIAGDSDQLWVADAGNHRVLGWDGELGHERAADRVLGQEGFQTASELPYFGQGPKCLRFPYAIDLCRWAPSDAQAGVVRLYAVADTANNRVLLWSLGRTAGADSAAIDVIGQVSFEANGENRWEQVTMETLCWPYGVSFHRGRLAIADSGNNRVVVWDCQALVSSLLETQKAKQEALPRDASHETSNGQSGATSCV